MAARRLIAVMLVLLLISSLAAALAPVDRSEEDGPPPAPVSPSETTANEGRVVTGVIDASAEREQTVKARVGDQLQLRVTSKRPGTVELGRIGDTDDVDPAAPARFDVLLIDDGKFPVRILEGGRRIGTIEVRPARPAPTGPVQPAPAVHS